LRAAAQIIDAALCATRNSHPSIGRQRCGALDRLEQRFLQHVLAIDDRTRHAGAISMQLGGRPSRSAAQSRHILGRRGGGGLCGRFLPL
jgi:hypothetical protein